MLSIHDTYPLWNLTSTKYLLLSIICNEQVPSLNSIIEEKSQLMLHDMKCGKDGLIGIRGFKEYLIRNNLNEVKEVNEIFNNL